MGIDALSEYKNKKFVIGQTYYASSTQPYSNGELRFFKYTVEKYNHHNNKYVLSIKSGRTQLKILSEDKEYEDPADMCMDLILNHRFFVTEQEFILGNIQ
jgi:hypothetical protein